MIKIPKIIIPASLLIYGLTFLNSYPCGLWDGFDISGYPTGGQIICRGFPIPALWSYATGQVGPDYDFRGLFFNLIFSISASAFLLIAFFWYRSRKKAHRGKLQNKKF